MKSKMKAGKEACRQAGECRRGRTRIFYEEIRGRYFGDQSPCPQFLTAFFFRHTQMKWWAVRKKKAPTPTFLWPQTLPVSRQGFASVVQLDNFHSEISRGWPAEELSSSLTTSRQAAGICQDGCYWAKQRDPCLPSSTAGNKGRQSCPCQSPPLLTSLRMLRLPSETRSQLHSEATLEMTHQCTGTKQQSRTLPYHTHSHTHTHWGSLNGHMGRIH